MILISLYAFEIYHILYTMAKIEPMQTDEESIPDIFEMSTRTNEPTKELVNKELQMFRKFQVHVKNIKCPLEWWG
jgi:hypothetical protein